MRRAWLVWIAACGGSEGGAPDAPSFGVSHSYVIDRVIMPTSSGEVHTYAIDLDGNGTTDNTIGNAITFFKSLGYDVQLEVDRQIDTGAVINLVDVQADELTTSAVAGLAMFEGANPMPSPCTGPTDPTCRRHLTGSGMFTTAPTNQIETPLEGSIASAEFLGGPGHLTVKLSIFPIVGPIVLRLFGARAKLSGLSASNITSGVLAGALSQMEIDATVLPAIQIGAMAAVARDCNSLSFPPDCGCIVNSAGDTMLGVFDANPNDCAISIDEVRTNNLVVGALSPDVMIDGQPAASLGLRITAVSSSF